MENLVISQMVKDLLDNYKKDGFDKIAYNYAYPVKFEFGANTENTVLSEKISISGSQLFLFQDILFKSDSDFSIMFKDVSTGRELAENFIDSQVLSYKNFNNSAYKGLWRFAIPKVMTGASELYISITNLSSSANNIILNVNGVSIHDR